MSTWLVVAVMFAAVAAVVLYCAKQRSEALDAQVARTLARVATAQRHIEILQAEWAQLDAEQRLRPLVKRTGLRPLKPDQYATLQDLPTRLPPRPEPSWASLRPVVPVLSRACLGHRSRRCAVPGMNYSLLLGDGHRLAH